MINCQLKSYIIPGLLWKSGRKPLKSWKWLHYRLDGSSLGKLTNIWWCFWITDFRLSLPKMIFKKLPNMTLSLHFFFYLQNCFFFFFNAANVLDTKCILCFSNPRLHCRMWVIPQASTHTNARTSYLYLFIEAVIQDINNNDADCRIVMPSSYTVQVWTHLAILFSFFWLLFLL